MSKKFDRCVYCLRYFDTLTMDHIPPKSWYPANTHSNLEKWKVPACNECNNTLGAMEHRILLRLGLSLDPQKEGHNSIINKVIRSISPQKNSDFKDQQHRIKQLKSVAKDFRLFSPKAIISSANPFPESNSAIRIPQELPKFINKMVRGLEYLLDGTYLSNDSQYTTSFIFENDIRNLVNIIDEHGTKFTPIPNFFEFSRIKSEIENTIALIYKMILWNKYTFYSITTSKLNLLYIVADVKFDD